MQTKCELIEKRNLDVEFDNLLKEKAKGDR